MKRNDFAVFLVYVAMFALALLVGLFGIQPIVRSYGDSLPIHFIALVILALVAGVLLNAVLLELGHLAGAKVGHYKVRSFILFGIGARKKEGKFHFGLYSYDGLTGETKVAPEDVEKSTLGAYVFLPILFYVVEAIVMMVFNALADGWIKTDASWAWLKIFSITMISVGGMIYLYDIFPARLDSINDGFLFSLFSHSGNRVAYNHLLVQEAAKEAGDVPPELPVFEEITDFTASLNLLRAYREIAKGDFDGAAKIIDLTLNAERGPSKATVREAKCIKLALLLASSKTTVGKHFYEEFTDDDRRYISNLSSMPTCRCYMLIAACVEDSESEVNYAIDKVEKLLKNTDEVFRESEKALVAHDKAFILKVHPTWELFPLPWEEEPEEETKEGE